MHKAKEAKTSRPSKMVPRPAWQLKCSAEGVEIEEHEAKELGVIVKERQLKDSEWRSAVLGLKFCVRCKRYGVQVAHRNESKAKGRKSSDKLTAALCQECHHEIDNGKVLTNRERREYMNEAIVLTLLEFDRRGMISIKESICCDD